MLAIFLNNKLITLDTILPLLFELKQRWPDRRLAFYCLTPDTERAIRANTVLSDALDSIGTLHMIGRRRLGVLAKIAHRARMLVVIGRLAAGALAGRVTLVHFKALSEPPLRLLFRLCPNRTFYVQASTLDLSETERRVDRINKERRLPKVVPAAGVLVGFHEDWDAFHDPRLADRPRHLVPPPFRRRRWHAYLDQLGSRAIAEHHPKLGLGPNERLIVFILSSMDSANILSTPDMFPDLFAETLDALAEAAPRTAVLIKPHPATGAPFLELQRNAIAARPHMRLSQTGLHPLLLARRAAFFVGNVFSSTFANAVLMGVPTIEYTSYGADTLAATGGASMRPDLVSHFVNRDEATLKRLVRELDERPGSATAELIEDDPETLALFDHLVGRTVARGAQLDVNQGPSPRAAAQ